MFTKILALITLLCSLSCPISDQSLYMRGMEITNIDYATDTVTCVDGAGFEWEFYGAEDYAEGDIVCCLMATMGTEDTIFDDQIVMVDYSGFFIRK